jgi:DNA-binding NarL/FixJ family response regulator
MIKVGLVDRQELFRESLQLLIDSKNGMQVVISKASIKDFQLKLTPGAIDLLLVDIELMTVEELKLFKEVIHHFPEIKIMVLTNQTEKSLILDLIRLRIVGYYSKEIDSLSLENLIRSAISQDSKINVDLCEIVKRKLGEKELVDFSEYENEVLFTPRECQILKLICLEKSNQEISEILELSVRTIETHRRRMITRTNSKGIIGVIMYAMANSVSLPEKHINARVQKMIA